jgi:hypothetical protein
VPIRGFDEREDCCSCGTPFDVRQVVLSLNITHSQTHNFSYFLRKTRSITTIDEQHCLRQMFAVDDLPPALVEHVLLEEHDQQQKEVHADADILIAPEQMEEGRVQWDACRPFAS